MVPPTLNFENLHCLLKCHACCWAREGLFSKAKPLGTINCVAPGCWNEMQIYIPLDESRIGEIQDLIYKG